MDGGDPRQEEKEINFREVEVEVDPVDFGVTYDLFDSWLEKSDLPIGSFVRTELLKGCDGDVGPWHRIRRLISALGEEQSAERIHARNDDDDAPGTKKFPHSICNVELLTFVN